MTGFNKDVCKCLRLDVLGLVNDMQIRFFKKTEGCRAAIFTATSWQGILHTCVQKKKILVKEYGLEMQCKICFAMDGVFFEVLSWLQAILISDHRLG